MKYHSARFRPPGVDMCGVCLSEVQGSSFEGVRYSASISRKGANGIIPNHFI